MVARLGCVLLGVLLVLQLALACGVRLGGPFAQGGLLRGAAVADALQAPTPQAPDPLRSGHRSSCCCEPGQCTCATCLPELGCRPAPDEVSWVSERLADPRWVALAHEALGLGAAALRLPALVLKEADPSRLCAGELLRPPRS